MSQKLTEQNAQMMKSNADIVAELQQVRDQMERLQANLDATNQRLEALSNELRRRAPGAGCRPRTGPAAAAAMASGAALLGARAAVRAGAALLAAPTRTTCAATSTSRCRVSASTHKRYPDTDLADNALYWIGECHYSKRAFPEAIQTFTELLNTYKTSDKAAAALLKKGLAHLEAGDRSQAVINLQYVLYEHPGSKEAELARTKLAALGVKVK